MFNGFGERRSYGHVHVPSFFNPFPNVALSACSDQLKSPVYYSPGSLLDGSRRHVHAHQFEGLSLLGQGLGYVLVGLAYNVAHFTLAEHSFSVGFPHGGNGGVGASHLGLEVLVADLLAKVAGEVAVKASVSETHAAESHLEGEVSVLTDKVLNSQPNGLEGIVNDLFAHLGGSGDGHRVGVDHSESLRVDGFLTFGGVDLLLSVVAVEVVLNLFINNKTRPKN